MRCWYGYTGSPGDEANVNNYVKIISPTFCSTGSNLCAILAPSCGVKPMVISLNIQSYIVKGKTDQASQPAGGPYYVHTKP